MGDWKELSMLLELLVGHPAHSLVFPYLLILNFLQDLRIPQFPAANAFRLVHSKGSSRKDSTKGMNVAQDLD